MYNVAIIKKTIKYVIVSAIIGMAQSCGNGNGNLAQDLLSQAQTAYEAGNYNLSVQLLDSLKKVSDDLDLLKKGLNLRTLNQEGLIKLEIAQNDSLITVLEEENKGLSGNFKYFKHKDMVEGFYVHKSIAGDVEKTDRSTLEPRIDENDMFYLVSYLTGHDVKHTCVKLNSNAGAVSTSTVAYDKAQNYRYNSGGVTYESITFTNAQCDTLGCFVTNNENAKISIVYQGKKSYSTPLNDKYKKAVAETYRYAKNKQNGKAAIKKRMFLEQKLELAKKQIEQTKVVEQ